MIVVTKPVVARSFARLRSQRTHEMFAGYLHLQQRAARLGRLQNLQPDFRRFFDYFFFVESHPVGAPYIKPFSARRATDKNLWLNPNVAGSYAPKSIRPGQAFSKVVQIDKPNAYSLPRDHAKRAFENLLYRNRVSAGDLAVFLYRNFGLIKDNPTLRDLIDIFAFEFGYASKPGGSPNRDFNTLFYIESDAVIEVEPWTAEPKTDGDVVDADARMSRLRTAKPVRRLTSQALLLKKDTRRKDELPFQELRVQGLLSFAAETVFAFGRVNVLVGPNGSGKSNLIDCLRVFREAPKDIQQAFARGGLENFLYNGLDKATGSGTLEITSWAPDLLVPIRHRLRLGPPVHSRAQLEELVENARANSEENPYFVGSYRSQATLSVAGTKRRRERELGPSDYNPFQSILSQIRDAAQYPEITRLAYLYTGCQIYSEWTFGRASKLREAATTERSDFRLSEDMHDLPVVLNALEKTPAHEKILKLLPELKETYRDYITRLMFGRMALELSEVPFNTPVPADRLSDGTLRFLALAAILLHPSPAPVVCMEEPELGMHPDMIRMVARLIVEASSRTQLIISTHSEDLLTALQDDFDVLFAFNAGPNGSVVTRFTRQQYKKWREEHSLGELWTSGELGGNRW